MSAETLIELEAVSTRLSGWQVLHGVSLCIAPGEATVFMGEAGSGKSNLLKVAAGLVVPEEGRVLWRGKDIWSLSRSEVKEFRGHSAFVFQDAALWANQSIYENLALPLRVHRPGLGRAELERAMAKAIETSGYVGELEARPAELSTGERCLAGLARALVLEPELLFLDEPTSALGEQDAEGLVALLADLRKAGKTIVAVSANSSFVTRLADRIGVLREGSLVAFGPYHEVQALRGSGFAPELGRLGERLAGRDAEREVGEP